MTTQSFYRGAAVLPFVVPSIAGILLTTAPPGGPDVPALTTVYLDVLATFALAGVFSAVPFLLYLLTVFGYWKPQTEPQFQRAVRLAPLAIGLPFGLVHALMGIMTDRGLHTAASLFLFWGGLAVTVGLAYAFLIEVLLWAAKRGGCIQRHVQPQA
jgi:hypothetical protein